MRNAVRSALGGLLTEFCPDDAFALARRLDEDEVRLLRIYRTLGAWPADGQFALHAVALIVGPGAPLRDLRRVVLRPIPDFRAAADTASLSDQGHCGVIAYSDRVRLGFRNAAAVVERNLNSDRLYYPHQL